MEKIIVNSYGDITCLNTETNEVREKVDAISYNTVFKAKEDAEVITNKEVINVKKGEYILTLHAWDKTNECRAKAIVISDPATIFDLDEWMKEYTKIGERNELPEVTNEAV